MGWSKLDDATPDHPKHLSAGLAADGLWMRSLCYANRHLTDGFIPTQWVRAQLMDEPDDLGDRLVSAGLWAIAEGGYQIHDYLDYNSSRDEVEGKRGWDNKRKSLHRDRPLVDAIRARDGDLCRYCADEVDWTDRRGPKGGTYDHIKPRGDNSYENVVVACRTCNLKKGARTPVQAEMSLLPDPDLTRTKSESNLDQKKSSRAPGGARTGMGSVGVVSTSQETETETRERADEIVGLCELLAALVAENGSKPPVEQQVVRWRRDCRLLLDADERNADEVEAVIRWCQADDFWRANILSMGKLRAKYDQLRLKARASEHPADRQVRELQAMEARLAAEESAA